MKFFTKKADLPADKAERVPPGQYLTEKWPVLHYGPVPTFNPKTWDLRVFGKVKNELRWTWDDGQVSEYAWEPFRRACPCAYCSGEGAYKGNVSADTTFTEKQTELKEVYAVGRYGLTPEWGDGHDTGIYTFKMLRRAAGLE